MWKKYTNLILNEKNMQFHKNWKKNFFDNLIILIIYLNNLIIYLDIL